MPSSVNSITDLRALSVLSIPAYTPIDLLGYYTPEDGGAGVFYWDPSSSTTDDNGTVIQPTSISGTGRWLRLYSGPINVRWFGATGNGSTADDVAIQNAINLGQGNNPIYFPAGNYLITATLLLYPHQIIFGEGMLIGGIAAYPRIAGDSPIQDTLAGEDVFSIVSATASGTTVTVQTGVPHTFSTGDTVATAFILPDSYCGIQTITVIDSTHFSYTVVAAPATSPGICYGARAAKMTYPAIPGALDWAAQTGGACFAPHPSGSGGWRISGIVIQNFRYGMLVSTVESSTSIGAGNCIIEEVTFTGCNIAIFGYPSAEGIGIVDCQFNQVNCGFSANSTCTVPGNPAASATFCDGLVFSNERMTAIHQVNVNFNFDIWFHDAILRPGTALIGGGVSYWYPYARGTNKIPPSESAISGHLVFMPARGGNLQYIPVIKNVDLSGSVRSGILLARPFQGEVDRLGNEVYTGIMPSEPGMHLLCVDASAESANIRRVQGINNINSQSVLIEIPVYTDNSNTVYLEGSSQWLQNLPHSIVGEDNIEPSQTPIKLARNVVKSALFSQQAIDPLFGYDTLGNGFYAPGRFGISEQGVGRWSNAFELGSLPGANPNYVVVRPAGYGVLAGFFEVMAKRLDTGAADYCKLYIDMSPYASGYNAGTLSAGLSIGQTSVTITPSPVTNTTVYPGVTVTIGSNTLVVKSYDSTTNLLTFYTGATASAVSGTDINFSPLLTVINNFSGSVMSTPYFNNAIILTTPLFANGASPPNVVPIAITYFSTLTQFFAGGAPQ